MKGEISMATYIIGAALIAVIALIIRSLIKKTKNGGCIGCSDNCGCCHGHCSSKK